MSQLLHMDKTLYKTTCPICIEGELCVVNNHSYCRDCRLYLCKEQTREQFIQNLSRMNQKDVFWHELREEKFRRHEAENEYWYPALFIALLCVISLSALTVL